MMPWQPVVDGEVIPARPIDRIVAGAGAGIDLMVGTNADEHRLFLVPFGVVERTTNEALVAVVAAYGLPVEAALTTYRQVHRGASAGDLLAAIQTDWYWRIPAIRLADAHASSTADTYMYEFAWRSPQFNGLLGACHSLEIPFVFDTLGNVTEPLWGPDPPQQLADTMHAAWVAFATSGDCGWQKYDLSRRATMRFDTTSQVVDDPRSAECALWESVALAFAAAG
jgi:para-nitrobenzyl esterase